MLQLLNEIANFSKGSGRTSRTVYIYIRNIISSVKYKWDLRKHPTNAWTSLIGSSPGHNVMLSGRQYHANLKLKEARFYEHLPILIFAINCFEEKLKTEHEFCFCRIITVVSVLEFSLNCIWLDFFLPIRTYVYSRLFSEKRTYVWQLRFVTVKSETTPFDS